MKVSTHPLMVAVAMGLLGPVVLTDDEHEETLSVQDQGSVEDEVRSALEQSDAPVWSQLTLDTQ